ncbi:outer membrane protein [Ferrimonas sediminum]|uniref:Outer membrane protein n=1 Tax=Ferrimonas sediminum TaxID=718193 RepID=A0A1G8MI54_9GAMM|nr:TIGR04219 family outer membrane beta-barrel protein [Ferrimonas sediminum]SDI67609.1 outer membrane protein [Ferrimonas sediminum]
MRVKLSLAAAAIASLISVGAHADALGVKVGLDLQQSSVDGNVHGSGAGWDDSYRFSGYVAFEHFIPLVPNVMIRHNQQEADGSGSLSADLTNTDFIAYYELLDNGAVELDLGANYRIYSGKLNDGGFNSDDLDDGILLVYAKGQVNLVGTGLFIYTDLSVGSYDDKDISDYQLGLGWELDMLPLNLAVKGGYRQHSFDVSRWGTNADLEFSGVFAGVELSF